jgi:hypothetical protein
MVFTELFLATAVILSPVYTAVTWQWVYMSQYVPLKCRLTFTRLYNFISQKTALFITTALRTSNADNGFRFDKTEKGGVSFGVNAHTAQDTEQRPERTPVDFATVGQFSPRCATFEPTCIPLTVQAMYRLSAFSMSACNLSILISY